MSPAAWAFILGIHGPKESKEINKVGVKPIR